MGKRRRSSSSATHFSSDSTPCSSGRDVRPGENSSDPDDSMFKPFSSVKGIMDSHGKQSNSQGSLGQHHCSMSRAMFLKRSRHHYGNQYSRRNSHNYHKPSTSHGKSSSHDERLSFKLGSKYNPELGHRPDFSEFREKASWLPERIRSASIIDAESPEAMNMHCGICHKSLTRKWYHRNDDGSTLTAEELCIVAVLVCGHIYHAECLEKRTRLKDKGDPPCPICIGLIPKSEAA